MYSEQTNQVIAQLVGQPSVEQVVGLVDGELSRIDSQIQSIRDRAEHEVQQVEARRAELSAAREEVIRAHTPEVVEG